jgi:branched-chain amino acid transport system permease protein
MDTILLNLLNGISFGSILFLLGSGLSLIFGVMGIINLAHGALYMVGGYVGWTVTIRLGGNFWLAALAGGATTGILGLLMERGFLRRLHQKLNEQVLLTFGFIYILTNLTQWIWGAIPKAPFTAPALNVSVSLFGEWKYPLARIVITGIGFLLAVGLWWLQDKTRVGAIIRAGMDDKEMTMGLGVNYGLVATAVFSLGCFVAGAAGLIGAHLFGLSLELGFDTLMLSLVVVVIGGPGKVQGALLGGIVIGLIISFGKALFPHLSMFIVYLAMIVVLLIKPTGIMGKEVRR